MAYLLFVDESGQDQGASPYEVLAGIAVRDSDLWPLIKEVGRLEQHHFGGRYSGGGRELKAKNLLKKKAYRQAASHDPIDEDERQRLARACLDRGDGAGPRMQAALAQAKIAFVEAVLQACAESRARVFATMVPQSAPRPTGTALRKDYAYLFERFSYFLEDDAGGDHQGIVVFDELERSRSHLLLDQMHKYFIETQKGQRRAAWIIPQPFFVHSDLTTGVQLADLIAYIVSWNFRYIQTPLPARGELDPLGRIVADMRYRAVRDQDGRPGFNIWSITKIDDLRPRSEREPKQEKAMPTDGRQSLRLQS
ncbi:MAG TPA: DUF3800 domain-containing protein [Acidimicrobiales bacterium]|nr:DUF3800 domain-containing protein [Acidimicrobiales bacterium]